MERENKSRPWHYAIYGGAALACALIMVWARGAFTADMKTFFGLSLKP